MSTIIAPTIETSCCNGFKADKVASDSKDSQNNLDFIVTFLNIPQTARNVNETDAQLEKSATASMLVQHCSSSEGDIQSSLDQNLSINLPNKVNNEHYIEHSNENNNGNDTIQLISQVDGTNIKARSISETTAETSISTNTMTATTVTNTNNHNKTIQDAVQASTPTTAIANEEEIDDSDEEEELTNLTWLTELRNQSITWPSSINPTILDDNLNATTAAAAGAAENNEVLNDLSAQNTSEKSIAATNNAVIKNSSKTFSMNSNLDGSCNIDGQRQIGAASGGGKVGAAQLKRPTPAERYQIFMDKVKRDLQEYEQSAVNYQTDTTEKPPFNYSHIIGMAMLEKGRVTLQQICSWIESKFAFFRVRKKWNNSIRHNLSLHHCFRKINRNKYEKGKGGYWELGVDPKKCDRKRIRNRKSANSMNKNKKTTVQNNNNSNSSYYSDQQETASTSLNAAATTTTTAAITHQHHHQQLADDDIDMELDVQIPADGLEEAEQMLLDDLDVQQNIDISSNQQQQHQQQQLQSNLEHQLQQEEAFIANVLANCIELDPATLNAEVADQQHVGGGNNLPTLTTVASLPQYQLGTVIISTSTDDMATTLNSFIYNNQLSNNQNSSNEFCPAQQHTILYREDEIPPACENVIVSSFLSDTGLDAGQHASISNPNRPNVIVEPLEPYYSVISASATTLVSTNGDGTTVAGEHFRPYIDGIDEAFQYLRSMDHNRSEDLLDNLLDISVSDY